ncbi:MAG: hypothetical protein A2729_02480 [Candidatus Buchananbacteria bacterium RIFCSPHIGHO2_01_FULL_39_14]|uniref:Uncharacterized protein n=2 Tax=Candidatus Buchananiibacteriota TaxID=1817903 RepID=A0A1G1YQ20_9BACT|nr:MAG: hypothetical protein A2729_02480 [Candidatus Buchananbacteria bacterium RIFCSPHIGHO2_01_FULL_39_14]OGY48599.1 MAG: hypothetical protein A3D39_01995 [Candidatus Buchananbacteria bacterium RIFCSPHIGHO2_02_FULL_39_17]OGY53916.1 MAG: hypothetical protein A2912_05025 [Candidatus Buchananbacteria bacterium RIFCSPLOWO2_01_FULL_40_23b]
MFCHLFRKGGAKSASKLKNWANFLTKIGAHCQLGRLKATCKHWQCKVIGANFLKFATFFKACGFV